MSFYRCYAIGPNGNTTTVQNFVSSNDADACRIADEIRAAGKWHASELWEGFRKVTTSPPQP